MAAPLTEIGEAREEADARTRRKISSGLKYCSERKEPSVPREELGDAVQVSQRKDCLKQGLREEKE